MLNNLRDPSKWRMLGDILISPRWHKVLNDFSYNKARLGLAVISIMVGVFALGTIMAERQILLRNIEEQFFSAKPASASLMVKDFDEGLIEHARKLKGVQEADGVRTVEMRVLLPPSKARGSDTAEWRTLYLIAIDNFDDLRLNLPLPVRGVWPPPKNTIVLERSSMKLTGLDLGDTLLIETSDGLQRHLPIVGVVKDVTVFPGEITGNVAAYVSFDTLARLEQPRRYNKLWIRVTGDDTDKAYVDKSIARLSDEIEWDGWTVISTNVPKRPGRPILETNFQTIMLILTIVGFLLIAIGGIMVANTMDALLTHEIKQIGIMRIIGGTLGQVVSIYSLFVVIMASVASAIAIPLASVAGVAFSRFIASLINFDITDSRIPVWIYAMQIALAFFVALLASTKPILSATLFTTVREAVSPYGLDSSVKPGLIEKSLGRIRGLASPVMLSLRNTFRKQWRLALTLTTLSLGGAIFVAVFCLRASLLHTALTLQDEFARYDLLITFYRLYHLEAVESIIRQVPGINKIEGWRMTDAIRLRQDGSESGTINITAAPAGTDLLKPTLDAGRWLLPEDDNAIVGNQYLFDREPDLHIGSEITIKYADRETKWRIVGKVSGIVSLGQSTPAVYVNYKAFAKATQSMGMVDAIEIVAERRDVNGLIILSQNLETTLLHEGYRVRDVETSTEILYLLEQRIGIITQVLVTISMLLAFVGGISLASTMGINVIERTREIGVMRAVGASSTDLLQITIVEGVITGWLSWIIAAIIANPAGRLWSERIGMVFIDRPLMFAYSYQGLFIWLAAVTIIAIIASIVPAQNAMRITVREAISYE
jgi:putative ABC transport system permease protein